MVRDPFANANDEQINGLINRLTPSLMTAVAEVINRRIPPREARPAADASAGEAELKSLRREILRAKIETQREARKGRILARPKNGVFNVFYFHRLSTDCLLRAHDEEVASEDLLARVDELKELNELNVPQLSDIIKNLEDMADTHHRQGIKAKFIADALPGLDTIFWPKLEGQEQRDRILNELFSQADEGSWDAAFVKSLNAWLKDCIKAAASHCDYAKLCNNMNPHKRKGSSSRSDTPFVPNKKGKGGKGSGVTSATIGSAPLDSAAED